MAALTLQDIVLAGLTPSFGAAAGGGDTFTNDGEHVFFVCKNGGGGSITVTFDDTGSVSPAEAKSFDADVEVTVGAGSEEWIGPFPVARFTTTVAVAYSGVTSVTVAALRLP